MPALLLVPHALPHRECVSPDERSPWDEGTRRRPHDSPLVPRRPRRVNRLLVRLCTPPTRSAEGRPCAYRPRRKRVLHRWRRAGACQQEDSVRRSTAPCAHNQPRSPRSHEVRVRSAQSCLTRWARRNLATGVSGRAIPESLSRGRSEGRWRAADRRRTRCVERRRARIVTGDAVTAEPRLTAPVRRRSLQVTSPRPGRSRRRPAATIENSRRWNAARRR